VAPETSLRTLVAAYARLRSALGDAIGDPELVQPTGEHFPDTFAPDAASVTRLFGRMVSYSPLADDLPVELAFLVGDEASGGGCGSGACGVGAEAKSRAAAGTVTDLGDRYRLSLLANDVANPVLLTTALARGVGALVLHEGGLARDGSDEVDAADAEICATLCGFGVLLAAGSAVWVKGCHGLTGIQATALTADESAAALALFTALRGIDPSVARRHLQVTPGEAYDDAAAWVESNPLLVDSLRRNPKWLESGSFDIEPTRGLLGRWLHKRRIERAMRAPAPAPKPALSPAKQRYLEEAKALVEETLGEG
jgi:hypothetical protein